MPGVPAFRTWAAEPGTFRCYHVDVDGGSDLKAHGNFVDHEYEIERDGDTVATVSKRWFRVRDTYGIEVVDGADDVLLLAVAVCIDAMSHD